MHNELIWIVVVIFVVIFLGILYLFALSKLEKYLRRKELIILKHIDKILNIIILILAVIFLLSMVLFIWSQKIDSINSNHFFIFLLCYGFTMFFFIYPLITVFERVYTTAKNAQGEKDIIGKIDELIEYISQNESLVLNRIWDNNIDSSDFYIEMENDIFKTCSWSIKLLDKEQKKVLLTLHDSYGGTLHSRELNLTTECYIKLLKHFEYSLE